MTAPADKVLRCAQCGKEFVWAEGEQQFYLRRGLAAPKRCQSCREEKKTGGTYGTQVVSVNVVEGVVLCRLCRRPASRAASFRTREAICSGCASGDARIKTEDSDQLLYAEWEDHFNGRNGNV